MSRKTGQPLKETIIFVADVGIEQDDPNGKVFIDTVKEVMTLIIQKKIFLRPNDEVGIILMGSHAAQNNFDNIEEFQPVQTVSIDTIKNINKIKPKNCHNKNWIKALHTAVELAKSECLGSLRTTLIMLSDYLPSDVLNAADMEKVSNSILRETLHLLCIGTKSLTTIDTAELNKSEKMILDLVEQVSGGYMTFNQTLPSFRIFGVKDKKPMAWKCDLEISDIKIKINAYILAKEEPSIPSWKKVEVDPDLNQDTIVSKKSELVDREKNIVTRDDCNEGYLYGQEFIPITEHEAHNLKIETEKSFILYGFTNQDLVKLDYRCGLQTHIILPSQDAEKQFFALVKAMADKKQVGLVRKVYCKASAPKMNVLVPCVNVPGEPWCMYMYELIYADERSVIDPRPYRSILKQLEKEENDAVDNLIDTMLLDDDVLKPAYRAINPNSPLPPVKSSLLAPIKATTYIANEKIDSCVEKLIELFPIPKEEKDGETLENNSTTAMDVEEAQDEPAQNKNTPILTDKDTTEVAPEVDLDDLFDD
ncbi:hypothetical protein HCN44_005604 [Aphidius gifuensis]|uniref:Ku domain-containing protein n=1 Tax=Aphidius gifuensis TaxID=684658 RepID=A0A834Y5W9_APHGI|nr:hypothetical protein HCN44_005604 [Aphidius gifuensis]